MASLNQTIQDVFNEPGCDKNQGKSEKERKKGCTKALQPGGAAGGCAFDGAKIALQPFSARGVCVSDLCARDDRR